MANPVRSENSNLLSLQESADYLGVHKNTIRNLITRKTLKAQRIGSRIVRIARADLDALFSTNESGEFGCWQTKC
jgi:excisionase family DNA binding protein